MPERQSSSAALARRYYAVLIVAVLLGILVIALLITATPLSEQLLPGGDETGDQSITNPNASLSSIFTPEVLYWRDEILAWAQQYQVNPNVIAIVIQIESCGGPTQLSYVGATGLMQVMPFHFDNGENMLNPDTNVERGMSVFYECLTVFADWDLGLALACYNGGPGVTVTDSAYWADETRYYYQWATGLWDDVTHHRKSSDTLTTWLQAGGANMCQESAAYLFPADEQQ